MDRYEEECKHNDDRTMAMASAISSTFVSLAGSSLTTVFGFLALCFMSFKLGLDRALMIVDTWLSGVYEGGRHARRAVSYTHLAR